MKMYLLPGMNMLTRFHTLLSFKTTDWSSETVEELGEYYGLEDEAFLEYLRTLGVRTWPGEGENKQAYERILCELHVRDWCAVTCASLEIEGNEIERPFSATIQPNTNLLMVNGPEFQSWELLNLSGQVVMNADTKWEPAVHLSNGVYLLRVTDVFGKQHVMKVVR